MQIFDGGDGNPNGDVIGDPCDWALVPNGGSGSTLYIKETGTGTNTGWVAK